MKAGTFTKLSVWLTVERIPGKVNDMTLVARVRRSEPELPR
jgi:hypothetical protein